MNSAKMPGAIPFRWSRSVTVLTVGVGAVCAAGVVLTLRQLPEPSADPLVFAGSLLLLTVIAALFCWALLLLPLTLRADANSVRIRRLLCTTVIPVADILDVRPIRWEELAGARRELGSGGFFGYTGRYRDPRLGLLHMTATEQQNLLLIVTGSRKYVISCTEAPRLLVALRWLAGRPDAGAGEGRGARNAPGAALLPPDTEL